MQTVCGPSAYHQQAATTHVAPFEAAGESHQFSEGILLSTEIPDGVMQDRKIVVECRIVHIMKARKRPDHVTLLEEVLKQCTLFKPTRVMVKERIAQLISREFLCHDPDERNVYYYVP